jgi:hypothetical protein
MKRNILVVLRAGWTLTGKKAFAPGCAEAIYPKLSRDLGGIPIRNFYFDGTQSDLDRDLGVYLELARGYQKRKQWPRVWPKWPKE